MTHRASLPASTTALLSAHGLRRGLLALLATLLTLWHLQAGAQSTQTIAPTDAYTEVGRLMRAGQLDEAMARADRHLQAQPRDPQMRFMKGVLQSQKGQSADAMVTFQRLTDEFPELPEPHNNLAVLHAAAGRYDQARASLEAAIRANPQYAVAHENLGDVHARLAEQAWARSLQIDAGNSRVPVKLKAVRSLFDTPSTNR